MLSFLTALTKYLEHLWKDVIWIDSFWMKMARSKDEMIDVFILEKQYYISQHIV